MLAGIRLAATIISVASFTTCVFAPTVTLLTTGAVMAVTAKLAK